jgi:putative Mg2+ transporter-C (MgtC) family protein
MLAAGSAALFIALSNHVVSEFDFPAFVRTDPIRIIRAIIVGVSFFGAGTILKRESQGRVEGLTTAAAQLAAAGVGIAVALRLWLVSVGTTVLILVVNLVPGMIEAPWSPGPAD